MSKLKLKKFSYFSIALLRDISFSENVEKLLVSGVLRSVYTKAHPLFVGKSKFRTQAFLWARSFSVLCI